MENLILALTLASMLANPDFEQFDQNGKPVGWRLPPKYRVEKSQGSNASCGLVYTSFEGVREYASQPVKLEPGRIYRFGALVKAEEVSGPGISSLCLSWTDGKGKWLGELRSAYITRSTDGKWVKLMGLTKPMGEKVAGGSFAFCTEDKLLGRFYIDHCFCEEVPQRPVVALYSSAYRDEAWEGEVVFSAELSPVSFGCPANELRAVFSSGSRQFAERPVSGDSVSAALPVAGFATGTNEVVCALMRGEKEIGSAKTVLVRTSGPTGRRVYLDRFGRTIVDGKPYFPFGMFVGSHFFEAKHLQRYGEAGFNCYMPYAWPKADEFKRATDAGFRCVYNVSAGLDTPDAHAGWIAATVKNLRNHPGVLGWYIFDEQPSANAGVLTKRYELVRSLDRDHPTWCAQDLFDEARSFIPATDVFGGDPYPIPHDPPSFVTKAMNQQQQGLMGTRPIWEALQFFSYSWSDPVRWKGSRRPTVAEMRSMTWQAIAAGARGIFYYLYETLCKGDEEIEGEKVEDLWNDLKTVTLEVKNYERVLLLAETEPMKDLPKDVTGRYFRENGECWRLIVNCGKEPVTSLCLEPYGIRFERFDGSVSQPPVKPTNE